MMPETADQEVELFPHQDEGFTGARLAFRVMTWADGDINVLSEEFIELCMN